MVPLNAVFSAVPATCIPCVTPDSRETLPSSLEEVCSEPAVSAKTFVMDATQCEKMTSCKEGFNCPIIFTLLRPQFALLGVLCMC